MRAFIPALLAFSVWIVAHLVIWRVRRPTGQYVILLGLCLVVLVAFLAGFHVVQSVALDSARFLPTTRLDYFNFVMLYMGLTLSYFITYPAVQADSPTMTILLQIERAGQKGLTSAELMDQLNDEILVTPRLDDLVTGNLVTLHCGRYVIGRRGALLAKIHLFYRAMLKMEKGG